MRYQQKIDRSKKRWVKILQENPARVRGGIKTISTLCPGEKPKKKKKKRAKRYRNLERTITKRATPRATGGKRGS